MKHYFPDLSGWLATLAFLGLFSLSGAAFAIADETLGPGDNIRITVFDNADLATDARLSPSGMIRFPLLGTAKLGGLSPAAAGERIAALLSEGGFVVKPLVTLTLIQQRSRQISVLGQVIKPGRYALDETTTTLTDILALAGGIGPLGDDNVTVVRQRNGDSQKFEVNVPKMYQTGDMSANLEVENGDTVFVRRAPMFYIYGQVLRAGSYRLENQMNIMQALTLSGGMTPWGTLKGIKIVRRTSEGTLAKLDVDPAEPVKPDDVIHIPESFF